MVKVKINNNSSTNLDEAKEDNVRKKYVDTGKVRKGSYRRIVNWVGDDRKNRLKYLEFITKMVAVGDESAGYVINLVAYFDGHKNMLDKSRRNIDRYKTLKQLKLAINDIDKKTIERGRLDFDKRLKKLGRNEKGYYTDVDVVFGENGGPIVVTRPYTANSSCQLGKGTAWCISMRDKDKDSESYGKPLRYFDDKVEKEGKIFYFIEDFRKRKKDEHRMIAIQMSTEWRKARHGNGPFNQGHDIGYDGYWDYNDNPNDKMPLDIYDLNDSVYSDDEWDKIFDAIDKHAQHNPPEVDNILPALRALNDRINNKNYDTKYLKFKSELSTIEYQVMVNYTVQFYINVDWIRSGDKKADKKQLVMAIRDANDELASILSNYVLIEGADFVNKDSVSLLSNYMLRFKISRWSRVDFEDTGRFSTWLHNLKQKLSEKRIKSATSVIQTLIPQYVDNQSNDNLSEIKQVCKVRLI